MGAVARSPQLRLVPSMSPLDDDYIAPPSFLNNAEGEQAVAERRAQIKVVSNKEHRSCDGS